MYIMIASCGLIIKDYDLLQINMHHPNANIQVYIGFQFTNSWPEFRSANKIREVNMINKVYFKPLEELYV